MDAVPGKPTTLWFTPIKTTKDMIKETGNDNFAYEIACDQMCGSGHTSMRGEIIVETQEEYDQWLRSQKAPYSDVVTAKILERGKAKQDSIAKAEAASPKADTATKK